MLAVNFILPGNERSGFATVSLPDARLVISLKGKGVCTSVQVCDSISPAPREFRSLAGRFRGYRCRMRVRASWLGAEGMILALLGGVREHASQFCAGQAEFAFRMLVSAFIPEFTRRECATMTEQRDRDSLNAIVYYDRSSEAIELKKTNLHMTMG